MAPRGENRSKLLDAMQTLSLAKGFPATTVDEVCAEANVSKGSFYHHFATKEDVGNAALDRYFDDLVGSLTDGPFLEEDRSIDRLRGFVIHAADVCAGPLLVSGCMLGSFALDLSESHPDVRQKLSNQFSVLAGFVAGLIDDAASEVGSVVPSERLAKQFLAIIEGSIVLAKAHADPSILVSGVELFAEYLDLLLQQKAPQ